MYASTWVKSNDFSKNLSEDSSTNSIEDSIRIFLAIFSRDSSNSSFQEFVIEFSNISQSFFKKLVRQILTDSSSFLFQELLREFS